MSDATDTHAPHDEDESAQTLAEVSARRLAARSQWQKALARAKDRFTPANLRDEAVHNAAETIGSAVDQGASLAWAHRWKIAIAGLLGGLIFARKPITKAATPLAAQARDKIGKVANRLSHSRKR